MDLRDELNLISQTNPTSRYCTEFLAATLVSPTTGKILRCSMISDGSSSKVLESDAVCMALHFFKWVLVLLFPLDLVSHLGIEIC